MGDLYLKKIRYGGWGSINMDAREGSKCVHTKWATLEYALFVYCIALLFKTP